MLFSRNSLIKLTYFIPLLFGFISYCSNTRKDNSQSMQSFSPMKFKMEVIQYNQTENTVELSLTVTSNIDTADIEMEIMCPTFLRKISGKTKSAYRIKKGERDELTATFKIDNMRSFKLKGALYGSYNESRKKVREVRSIYFFYNENEFMYKDDPNEFLGRQKKFGGKITKEDLRIFNKIESTSPDSTRLINMRRKP